MRDIDMSEVVQTSQRMAEYETFGEEEDNYQSLECTKGCCSEIKGDDCFGEDQDLDSNLYLVGVLDQDLINGWEAWMTVLTSKEFLPDFSDTSLNDMMDKYIRSGGNDVIPSVETVAGNVTSKPPRRPLKKGLLLISRKQWKPFADFVSSFHSNLLCGAESWFKKIFHNNGSCKGSWTSLPEYPMMGDDASSTVFKKWVSVKQPEETETKRHRCFGTRSSNNRLSAAAKMRIEIKTDQNATPKMEDEDFLKLLQNEWIRIKVTMFCLTLNIYQMEIDLVQSFACATKTDRCRRRIAKVVKRDIVPVIEWEKGVNAAGNYFAVHWNRFQIPELSTIEQDKHDKFELCDFEYELRLRFFTDDEVGQTVASACSFPIVILGSDGEE